MIDRRQFVASAGSLIAVSVAASLRHAALAAAAPAAGGARLDALFDTFMDERFAHSPDLVTILGLDTGKYAASKSKLTPGSLAHWREDKEQNASQLKRLRAFRRAGLGAGDLANYDTVEFTMETRSRGAPFEYGEVGRPYVVSQLTGAYQQVPTFLDKQHKIENKADADAYLARLRAFAKVMDEEIERIRHDAGLKVIPPDFLIDRTLEQMHTLRSHRSGAVDPRHLDRDPHPEARHRRQLRRRCRAAGRARGLPGARPPGGGAARAAPEGGARRRGGAPARGRHVLPGGAAGRHHHRDERRGGAPARAGAGQGPDRAHGYAAAPAGAHGRHGVRACPGARQGPEVPLSQHRCGQAAGARLLQRADQGAAAAPAEVLPPAAQGTRRDPARTGLHRGRRTRGLLQHPRSRRLAPRRLLHQPARHRRVVALEAADARVPRVRARASLPAGAGAGDAEAPPDPQGGRRLLREHGRLGAVRRESRRRDGDVRRRPARPLRHAAVGAVPRGALRGRHRAARQGLEPRAGHRLHGRTPPATTARP